MRIYGIHIIKKVNPSFLYKAFKSFKIKEDGSLYFDVPQVRSKEFISLKNIIEYKYGIPIQIIKQKDDKIKLQFCKYSTYKFLTIIRPFIEGTKHYLFNVNKCIAQCEKSFIKLYLAGPIEKSPDGGRNIRNQIKKEFKFTNVHFIDPLDFSYNKNLKSMKEYKKQHTLRNTYWLARNIILGDLHAIEQSDGILLWVDKNIGYGSTSESTVSLFINKPVYAILDWRYKIKSMNPWLLGCVTRFFESVYEFRKFMTKIV